MGRELSIRNSDGFEIQVKHPGEADAIEMAKASIVDLIEATNLDDADDPERVRFYGGVLKGLATHYGMDCPHAEECTYSELIEGIQAEVGVPAGLGCKFEFEEA